MEPTRFPSPLIKPDVWISNIRLSDWFHRSTHASGPHHMVPGDDTEDFLLRTATQRDRKVTVLRGVVDSSSITAPFLLHKHTRSKGPSLRRHYPASTVL